jgi:hypothetical protein
VEALLQHVRDGKIRVPEFQRPLRWRANNVLDLFDSVYRGFPIGDLLLYKRQGEATTLHFGPVHVEAPSVAEAYLVVDGQQRVTALAGAMLHPEPEPRGDSYAVWFDLEAEQFVRSPTKVPPQWIPLNVVGDSFALLNWLNEWPFRTQRPDLVQRAIALGKALREYQVPAYIVDTTSDRVLRLIFNRVNTSGVPLTESEVFGALFGDADPHPIESACARLHTATGFGELPAHLFLACLRSVAGHGPFESLRQAEAVAKLDRRIVERVEEALLRAFRFLIEDAGVFHVEFLPTGNMGLSVLARFFDVHAQPVQRTRNLLARWWWRILLRLDQTDRGKMGRLANMITRDEFESIERLLSEVQMPSVRASPSTIWRQLGPMTLEPSAVLALVHLRPRDPESGDVLALDDIRGWLSRGTLGGVFLDVDGLTESIVARRFVVSGFEKIDKLATASDEVLRSHGLDRAAADALGRGDIDAFVERRSRILEPWFERFFAARIGADDGDRPPIAELVRRADRELATS